MAINSLFFSWGEIMPIYTTYLANKPKFQARTIGSCFIYFVMRNRGNNAVAPMSQDLIDAAKDRAWAYYEKRYKEVLATPEANKWMELRAQEAIIGNIILVCYEKDATNCHRRLLAEEIARRSGAEYKDELPEYSWECHFFSARIVNNVCQSPKKNRTCLQCRFRPKER